MEAVILAASDKTTSILELRSRLAEFARERDWEKFHSPKNLSVALAVEIAELLELFQWKTEQESYEALNDPLTLQRLREEIADVAIYLLNLCNKVDVDLASAIVDKIAQNAAKYPAPVTKARTSKILRALHAG
jgi:dCTP diphosphatase